MLLGMEEGLGPGDFVLDGEPAPLFKKGAEPPPQFSAHVHCGQTAGWIKMKLGKEVGLGPGYIVLDWDPAPLPKRGRSPFPIFGSFLLWPNGWMHQGATRYGDRLQPRRVCVRWGPSPLPRKGAESRPQFYGLRLRISKLDRKCRALPVIANFVALEQQIILVNTRSESV